VRYVSVLIVSNDDAITGALLDTSGERGWQITVHAYGLRALFAFHDDPSRFDLAILDEEMDDVAGSTLAELLLNIKRTARVILILTMADSEMESKAKRTGVRKCLAKPVSRAELLDAVNQILGQN
jgi:two-component system, cell cycle sensor histidine kinase and response regulator CckA